MVCDLRRAIVHAVSVASSLKTEIINMKHKKQLSTLLLLLFAIFLVACGSGANDQSSSAEVETEIAEEELVVVVERGEGQPESVAVVSPTDFDQIGQTGRPVFLNSYASW